MDFSQNGLLDLAGFLCEPLGFEL